MREERGGRGGRGGDKKDAKGGADSPRRGFFRRRRVCKFCAEKIDYINYKDVPLHQRKLQVAIKRARQLALIPYVTD
jgi:small subunit ribosomal protein S18